MRRRTWRKRSGWRRAPGSSGAPSRIRRAIRTRRYTRGPSRGKDCRGAEAARSLSLPFVLTGAGAQFSISVAESRRDDRRLQAFEQAGADVLFAPGLPDVPRYAHVSLDLKTVQFHGRDPGQVVFGRGTHRGGRPADQPGDVALSRGYDRILDAARGVKAGGRFDFLEHCVTTAELNVTMGI